MTPAPQTLAVAAVLLVSMATYALFAGADFGGGIWDLLAGDSRRGARPRAMIDESVTPVWEANHVWLIFALVLLWTAFPAAFAAVMTTLFVPLSLSLLGIVLRGVGFAFRHQVEGLRSKQLFGVVFAGSSLLTPFFLGTIIGAVATGRVRLGTGAGGEFSAWTTTTALLTGSLFLATCAYIAATYLVGDAQRRNDSEMVNYFRRRAIAAGIVTGALTTVTLFELSTSGPYVFHRLIGPALPLVALSLAAGTTALALLVAGRTRGLRPVATIAVASVVAGWAWGQYPWLLPTSLDLQAGSAPSATLLAELATVGLAVAFVGPGFAILYWLQQHDVLKETDTEGDLRRQLAASSAAQGEQAN